MMGLISKLLLLIVLGVAIFLGYIIHNLNTPPNIPSFPDVYWGPGPPAKDSNAIKPFKISFPQADLDDLYRRLNSTRKLTAPLENTGFQYGMNTNYLNSIIEYWRTGYNWKKREEELNRFPHFTTQISGLKIHFMHVKPNEKDLPKDVEVVPLLLLHGWPGSIKEFYGIIPLLTSAREKEKFVFEVIAPSLPGYGFSEGSVKPGLGIGHMAVIMHKLMTRLGFKSFYVQGGDWGSFIGSSIAVLYPDSVKGYHSNLCSHGTQLTQIRLLMSYLMPSLLMNEEPKEKLGSQLTHIMEETGYMHIQATKPDTVGVALSDSPAGLAAYILEKFSTWTNNAWKSKPDGGLSFFSKDDLLDNVMIYWMTNSITTSVRLYSETLNKRALAEGITKIPVPVPTGCARFPSELTLIPKRIIESAYPKLVRFSDMPKGGHFAAFEVPHLLAEDIWQFVDIVRELETKAKRNPK